MSAEINLEIEKFLNQKTNQVTAIVTKGDAFINGSYKFYMTGYLEELPFVIAQSDSWDEHEIKKELSISYMAIRLYHNQNGRFLELPEKLDYIFKYVSLDEFLETN